MHKSESQINKLRTEISQMKDRIAELETYKVRVEKAERRGELSEIRYASLFKHMLDGFSYHEIILNENGKPIDYVFLEINDAFEKQTGLKRKDILGKRVTEVLPDIDNDPADWIGRYGKVALTGKKIRFEQYSEQIKKWYSVLAYSPSRNYFATTFHDISNLKFAEEALLETEKRYKILSAAAFEGIVLSHQGIVMDANDQISKILGCKRTELIGRNAMEFVAPQSKALVIDKISSGFEGSYEHMAMRFNGIQFPVEVNAKRMVTGGKQMRVTAIRDITNRKKAAEALRKSETKFKQLIDGLPDAIFITQIGGKERGKIIDINPAAEIQTGYNRKELIGKNIADELLVDLDENNFAADEQRIKAGEIVRLTEKRKRKDGTTYWAQVQITTLLYDGKNRALSVNRDVTDLVKAENELKQHREHLEELVDQRTAELKQKQAELVHAGSLASLGEMASGMAHEINQPLAIINVQIDLFKILLKNDTLGTAELEEGFQQILDQVNRATVIIKHLTDFSQQDQAYTSRINGNQIINQCMLFFKEKFKADKVEFHTKFDKTVPEFIFNPQSIEQVVVSLLSNANWAVAQKAKEHSEEYEKEIELTTKYDKKKNHLIITVKDNGIGMSDEEMKKCIEPFYTRKKVGQGTGLGLSIVHGIVQAVGGKLMIGRNKSNQTVVDVQIPIICE